MNKTMTKKPDIKKLNINLDKTNMTANKPSDPYRYLTASVDHYEDKGDIGVNFTNKQMTVISPIKNTTNIKLCRENNEKEKEKEISITNLSINQAAKGLELSVKPLNELLSVNNKSRNVRNNLINNKSSLFNSDKVLSHYSASYNNKNHMHTHIINKNINNLGTQVKQAVSKANSNSKSRINSSIGNKKKQTPNKVQVNLSQKSYCQSGSIRTSQKVIPTKEPEVKQIVERPLNTATSGEDAQRVAKSNFSVFLHKNLNLLKNTQSKQGNKNLTFRFE
jgi:hypothetical protein